MSDQSEIRTTDPTMIWTGWIKKGELPGTIDYTQPALE